MEKGAKKVGSIWKIAKQCNLSESFSTDYSLTSFSWFVSSVHLSCHTGANVQQPDVAWLLQADI